MTGSDLLREAWSIWWAVVYFEDSLNESKVRPVIILEDRSALCLSLKVTSREKNDRFHVKIKQWEYAGLDKPSWVDISKILEIDEKDFKEKIGTLDPEDVFTIMTRMRYFVR